MVDVSAERQYAEEAALVLEGMGLTRAYGKILGWLLICEPPAQRGTEIAAKLGLSKGSVSAGLRMLESTGLVRRVAVPGRRGSFYEMAPEAFLSAAGSEKVTVFRNLMEDGLKVVGGEDAPGAERLRMTRDFYAFMEREVPLLVERFRAEYNHQREGQSDG
jgi:DNA-binding MarR family transcriptional regulator